MLKQRVKTVLNIEYESKLLVYDKSGFIDAYDYRLLLREHGFRIYDISIGIEEFRLIYEKEICGSQNKCAVVLASDAYIPYDIQSVFFKVEISHAKLFPNLDPNTLVKYREDLELISVAYEGLYSLMQTPGQTEIFVREKAMSRETITLYGEQKIEVLRVSCCHAVSYLDWICIAKQVARLNYYGAIANTQFDLAFIDKYFERYIASDYGKLSGITNLDSPAILPKALGVVTKNASEKVALIVMDGMSLFDFEVLSRYMDGFKYEYNASFALIPTTTSVSRQCLLSAKYPQQLANPFSLSGEEKGFIDAGLSLGYTKQEIQYLRGYEPDIGMMTRLAGIVINEVDDVVHGQQHGRSGMLGSIKVLAESGKLQKLVRELCAQGFTVYLAADHGNTPCRGVGRFRSGVEVETKSKRMVALKDFAEETDMLRENTVLFPGTYLDKSYRYYICKRGISFDNKGDEVMTHGGISIDEVIVPFIRILEA